MQSIPHSQHTNYINTANTVANNSIKSMRLSILWEKLSIFCWLISTLIKTKKKSCNFMLHALLLHRLVIESQMRLWGTFVIETIAISLPKKETGIAFLFFNYFPSHSSTFQLKLFKFTKLIGEPYGEFLAYLTWAWHFAPERCSSCPPCVPILIFDSWGCVRGSRCVDRFLRRDRWFLRKAGMLNLVLKITGIYLLCCSTFASTGRWSFEPSSLTRLILRICSNSLTAAWGILKVFAQSVISCTVISAELLNAVLLDKSSSKGSSLMLMSSWTCGASSFFLVIVMGSETMDWGDNIWGEGGTICVLPVMMMESLAFRFLRFAFCLLIGVIVMSLFSISFRICEKGEFNVLVHVLKI